MGSYEFLTVLRCGWHGRGLSRAGSRLDRDVAIKILPAALAADDAFRDRFEREARAVAALSHPHILAVYDVSVTPDGAYVVTELVDGDTLRGRLADARCRHARRSTTRRRLRTDSLQRRFVEEALRIDPDSAEALGVGRPVAVVQAGLRRYVGRQR
jgi:serine/threonine protein kinase